MFFLWIPVGLCLLTAVIGPKRMWWGMTAWQYRDPEANEPSDASYAYQRGVAAVAGVLGALYLLFGNHGSDL